MLSPNRLFFSIKHRSIAYPVCYLPFYPLVHGSPCQYDDRCGLAKNPFGLNAFEISDIQEEKLTPV